MQLIFGLIMFANEGLEVICFKHFAIRYRLRLAAFTFEVAAAFSFSVIPFVIEVGTKYLEHNILWVIYVIGILGFLWALQYLKKLEKTCSSYDDYPELNEDGMNAKINSTYEANQKDNNINGGIAINLLHKLEKININLDIEMIKKAVCFDQKWHGSQLRKNGDPFITHPLCVAQIVSDFLLKTQVIVAAILLNIIEDTECTIRLISEEYIPYQPGVI